jgi:hypothetical protein
MPQLAINRIVVSEYKVHWAGWPDEDDTWDIGTGNIAKGFIDEYHALTDLLRDISIDTKLANPKDMVFKDDLPKSGRGRPYGGSRQSTGSLGPIRGGRQFTVSFAANSEVCLKVKYSHAAYANLIKMNAEDHGEGAMVAEKYQDEEMLDDDEDIAIAKVVQASLDDAKAEETKAHLKALQKAMGVAVKQSETSAATDADIGAENDRFMEPDEPDGDGENDFIMAEGDDIEEGNAYLGGGGYSDGDEV